MSNYPEIPGDPRFKATATWLVPIGHQLHSVEMVNQVNMTSLIVSVDGKEVLNKKSRMEPQREVFQIGGVQCAISVGKRDKLLLYSLEVAGKSLKVHKEEFFKKCDTWYMKIDEQAFSVVLDKQSLELYVNGKKTEAERQFADEGTVTYFQLGSDTKCRIEASGCPSSGMVHKFFMGEKPVALLDAKTEEIHEFDCEEFIELVIQTTLKRAFKK